MSKVNKFRLKYLPKIGKRDKAVKVGSTYVACVNGIKTEFSNKMDLIVHLDTFRHHFNEIESLSVMRVDLYELPDFKF